MFTLKTFSSIKPLVALAVSLAALVSGQAWAQAPSQKPLLNRDGGGVKPNIMLTMDDSGSMMFQHMPEKTVYVGSYAVNNPLVDYLPSWGGTLSVRMDPGDNATLATHFVGTIAAQQLTGNYRQKMMRSPDTNTIYYNPENRYDPWPLAASGRMANSPVAAAYRDPMNPGGGGVINLTNVRSVNTTWCFRDNRSDCSSSSESYDPGLYYRLNKLSGAYKDPRVAGNYTEYSINVNPTFPKVAARTDCAAAVGPSGCSQVEERQNFANWFTYYRTRNLLARGSLAEAFNDSADTFRLGWGRINQSTSTTIDGVSTRVIEAGVRDFTAATKSNLFDWLYALPALGGTPLPRAMRAVGEYYKRTDAKGPWADNPGVGRITADKSCRRAYQIMVTDGYWNDTTTSVGNSDNTDGPSIGVAPNVFKYSPTRPYQDSNSNTLADYAMEYWKKDLRTDLDNNVVPSANNPAFWQHMVDFMVGLGVRGTLDPATDLPALTAGTKSWGTDKIDDLWHSALNSRGEFISAKDPKELATGIRDSVGQALQRELREAGVATASTVLQDGNRKYIPLYKTAEWNGDVQAYVLDASGQTGVQAWAAEAKLPAWASRNIYTWRSDTLTAVPFTWAAMGADSQAALGSVASAYTTSFVDFLRGDRSREGDAQPFRARKGVLGDFVNSNPVLVKDAVNMGYASLPALQGGGTPYTTFLTAKAARAAVLFVGGNDGMLHAFKDTLGAIPADDGKEVFAYVPRTVYPNLYKLSDKTYGTDLLYHQFFVDGPLMETDAFVRAPAASTASWRNYVLGSLGAGGRAVFALDVTDSASLGASNIRWELSSSSNGDLGYVSERVQVGVLPNGEWVAVFGNGSYSNSGKAVLFVVNLETGSAQTLEVDSSGSNGLGGVGLVRNSSGQITSLYAGDLKGKMWKFDYLASASSRFEVAGGTAFFSATSTLGVAQPITAPPLVYDHSQGGKLLLFGTGVLNTETDASSTAMQSIYVVWDKPSDSMSRPLDRSALVSRTLTPVTGADSAVFYSLTGDAVNWTTQRGWVTDLDPVSGLRVIYPPQTVTSEFAMISAIAPAQSVLVCSSATGTGLNLVLNVESGLNPDFPLFDTNGDNVFDSSDAIVTGYATNADGIDAVVKGITTTSSDTETTQYSSQNTTGQMRFQIRRPRLTTGTRAITDRVWRRIINPPIR